MYLFTYFRKALLVHKHKNGQFWALTNNHDENEYKKKDQDEKFPYLFLRVVRICRKP